MILQYFVTGILVIFISNFRIVSSGGQKLVYNWTVDFSAMPKDQRHNLMVWQSVRMFQTDLNKASGSLQNNQILINTSMVRAHNHTFFISSEMQLSVCHFPSKSNPKNPK
jgi:hypothetical protein